MEIKPNQIDSVEQLRAGAIFLVDKPFKWTSFDVVNKLRWLIRKNGKIKKIKVGHAGTLDPLATGLLVICVGKMTKQIQHLQSGEKTYTGSFRLGQVTPSFDLETEPIEEKPYAHLTEEEIKAAAKTFEGEHWQKPPIFSAKKIEGKRAYDYARKGKEVEIPESLVFIHSFSITGFQLPEVEFEIRCTKGTYIRTIADDFGKSLKCGAYLKSLRRTQSGTYSVDEAWLVEKFENELGKLKPETNK